MWGWLLGANEDNSEERESIKPVCSEWQDNLNNKGIKSDERKIEMNENYKSLFGHKAHEIREISGKDDTIDSLNNNALKATKDLLKDQTNNTRHLKNKNDVKEQLEEDRSERHCWFW